MSLTKNYFWDEINDPDNESQDPGYYGEEYDIIEPALTNEPMSDDPPF